MRKYVPLCALTCVRVCVVSDFVAIEEVLKDCKRKKLSLDEIYSIQLYAAV